MASFSAAEMAGLMGGSPLPAQRVREDAAPVTSGVPCRCLSAQVSGFQISPAGPGPHTTTLAEGSDSSGALQLYLSSPATQLYLPPTPGVRAPFQAHTHTPGLPAVTLTHWLLVSRSLSFFLPLWGVRTSKQ